jgi:hypothetical protein
MFASGSGPLVVPSSPYAALEFALMALGWRAAVDAVIIVALLVGGACAMYASMKAVLSSRRADADVAWSGVDSGMEVGVAGNLPDGARVRVSRLRGDDEGRERGMSRESY